MSRKTKESTHDALLMEQKTKLLIPVSKPRIHERFPWIHKENKTGIHQKKIWQNVCVYW